MLDSYPQKTYILRFGLLALYFRQTTMTAK